MTTVRPSAQPGPGEPGASGAVAELTAFAPRVRPPTLPCTDLAYAVTDTVIGRLLLAVRDDGRLVTCAFASDVAAEDALLARLSSAVSPRILRTPGALDEARHEVDDYLAGRRVAFDLATDLVLASPFQRQVLSSLTFVGYGQRTTYAAVAAAIGRPSAARAVGTALGANPLCLVIPCHRVLPASGKTGGYAGGAQAKATLLHLEAQGPQLSEAPRLR